MTSPPYSWMPFQNLTEELFTAMACSRLSQFRSRKIVSCLNLYLSFVAAVPPTEAILSVDKSDFLKLQNGSDIRGVAVAGVEGEPVTLTEPITEAIAAAFASWLQDRKKQDAARHLRISIGHDSRVSAKKFQDAVSKGITHAGLDVIQYGLASTPATFNCTLTENEDFLCPVDGSIMIKASHLPYNHNGFKFFTSAGELTLKTF